MGIYADLLANTKTIDTGGADGLRLGNNRALHSAIDALRDLQGDLDYPAGFDLADEVQSIAVYTGSVTGGTFTITINLNGVPAFTTAGIAHDANAATIEAAIDTAAAAASVPDFTAGDIAVTGGPLTTTPLTLTYSGDSVSGKKHSAATIDGASLTGGTDEVQEIAVFSGTVTGGTYDLAFNLQSTEQILANGIAFDADAAAIEAVIDAAAVAVVGWTNGDIAVTGGPLTTTPAVFTFSGASVSGQNHDQILPDGGTLTGGGTMGTVSTTTGGGAGDPGEAGEVTSTTNGQSARTAWAILKALGIIAGTPPAQGTSAAVSRATTPNVNPYYPDQELIKALAEEAAIEDDNLDVKAAILAAVNLS